MPKLMHSLNRCALLPVWQACATLPFRASIVIPPDVGAKPNKWPEAVAAEGCSGLPIGPAVGQARPSSARTLVWTQRSPSVAGVP